MSEAVTKFLHEKDVNVDEVPHRWKYLPKHNPPSMHLFEVSDEKHEHVGEIYFDQKDEYLSFHWHVLYDIPMSDFAKSINLGGWTGEEDTLDKAIASVYWRLAERRACIQQRERNKERFQGNVMDWMAE